MTSTVAVIMSVHNGWPFLEEAVESVLTQSHPGTHLVVIDDGSTDEGAPYLDGLDARRATVLRNRHQMGLSWSLRRGISESTSRYIARLDADDAAEPWRIASQVADMEARPSVALTCASGRIIDESGSVTGLFSVPKYSAALMWELTFRNPVAHSSVMIRRASYEAVGGYADVSCAEDYDLWSRLVHAGFEISATDRPAVRLRKHGNQMTERRRTEMLEAATGVAAGNIEVLMSEAPEARLVRALLGASSATGTDIVDGIGLLAQITRHFLAQQDIEHGARSEIRARMLEYAWGLAYAAGLQGASTRAALRSCVLSAGLGGLVTGRGCAAAAHMCAPRLMASLGRFRTRLSP